MKRTAFGLVAAAGLIGCGPTTYVTVMKPAEVNLKGVKRIGVAEFNGRKGADMADRLVEGLGQSGRFEVVDRQHLSSVVQEQKLGASGAVDEASAAQAGKLAGVQALIFGRVTKYNPRQEVRHGERTCDKDGCRTPYWRNGQCDFGANVKVVLTDSGRVAASKTYSDSQSAQTSAVNQEPEEIDLEGLCDRGLNNVSQGFINALSPHPVQVPADFKSVSNDANKRGIELVKAGQMEQAVEAFLEASQASYEKAKDQAKVLYNLGVAYEFTEQFKKSQDALNAAIKLDPDSDYVNELARCRKAETDKKKLDDQMQDAAGAGTGS